jgi:hypothetical protein
MAGAEEAHLHGAGGVHILANLHLDKTGLFEHALGTGQVKVAIRRGHDQFIRARAGKVGRYRSELPPNFDSFVIDLKDLRWRRETMRGTEHENPLSPS